MLHANFAPQNQRSTPTTVLPTAHPVVNFARHRIEELLTAAGLRINGDRCGDPQVHDAHFYTRTLAQGSLGFGESYMDGQWDAEPLDETLFRLLDAHVDDRVHGLAQRLDDLRAWLLNQQTKVRSAIVGEKHYDLGNDLYAAMLDPRMIYSCGYWRHASTLAEAQTAKLDLVCRKLGLEPGMRVLDIGCGWGGALRYAAETYGVHGVGLTISAEQAAFARQTCAGFPIDIRLQDYRDLHERFDRVLSIGMFEHVGVKNYRGYFETVRANLADDGLFLLHTIGNEVSTTHTDPWIERHIFPNSMLPSVAQIAQGIEGLFVMEDWHNFGADYDRTLQAWRDNIERAWTSLPTRYDELFRRMWRYYLAASMAAFRARRIQLWQVVLSPRGVPDGYLAPR